MTQTRKETSELLCSKIISTGDGQNINNVKRPKVSGKIDEQSSSCIKLPFKLKSVKGLPWSLFTGNVINKSINSAIPTNEIVNKRPLIQLPHNWKMRKITPVEANDIIKTMKTSISSHGVYGDISRTINHCQQSVMSPNHAKIEEPASTGITKF